MMSQYWPPQRVQRYKTPLLHHVRPKVAASQAEAGDNDYPRTPAAIAAIKKLFMTSSVVCSQKPHPPMYQVPPKSKRCFQAAAFRIAAASRALALAAPFAQLGLGQLGGDVLHRSPKVIFVRPLLAVTGNVAQARKFRWRAAEVALDCRLSSAKTMMQIDRRVRCQLAQRGNQIFEPIHFSPTSLAYLRRTQEQYRYFRF